MWPKWMGTMTFGGSNSSGLGEAHGIDQQKYLFFWNWKCILCAKLLASSEAMRVHYSKAIVRALHYCKGIRALPPIAKKKIDPEWLQFWSSEPCSPRGHQKLWSTKWRRVAPISASDTKLATCQGLNGGWLLDCSFHVWWAQPLPACPGQLEQPDQVGW